MTSTKKCYVTMGIGICLTPEMVDGMQLTDREDTLCIINVYSSEEDAKLAVETNNSAIAEMHRRIYDLEDEKLHNFLKSEMASLLNSLITGEEWYEQREYYPSNDDQSSVTDKRNQDE